jgi:1,4-alpha-glucan branching enzyme
VASALMKDKDAASYDRAWTKLFIDDHDYTGIRWVVCDNEPANWGAALRALPHLTQRNIVLCQWHRQKNYRDRALDEGLGSGTWKILIAMLHSASFV